MVSVAHCRLTTKLSDRRRTTVRGAQSNVIGIPYRGGVGNAQRPVGCNSREQITCTVQLPSGAALQRSG
jgi:hypothetical protein